MEVRTFDKRDLTEVVQAFKETFNAPPWSNRWSDELAKEAMQQMLDFPLAVNLVAFEDGRCVGGIFSNIQPYSDQYSAYLREFFVVAEKQGSGLAEKLFTGLEEALRNAERPVSGLFFSTTKGIRAYHFYKKMGCYEIEDGVLFYKTLRSSEDLNDSLN